MSSIFDDDLFGFGDPPKHTKPEPHSRTSRFDDYQWDRKPWRRGACHRDHPELHIGGGVLLGGSCRDHSRHEGVNLYVALDGSQQHPVFDPGVTSLTEAPVSFYYPIHNMGVPAVPETFVVLIGLIVSVLGDGGTVHVGCIGGHGRTGLVLAAVVAMLEHDEDPIAWVREHYCHRAVESRAQEGFLAVHFGCPMPPDKLKVDKPRKGV